MGKYAKCDWNHQPNIYSSGGVQYHGGLPRALDGLVHEETDEGMDDGWGSPVAMETPIPRCYIRLIGLFIPSENLWSVKWDHGNTQINHPKKVVYDCISPHPIRTLLEHERERERERFGFGFGCGWEPEHEREHECERFRFGFGSAENRNMNVNVNGSGSGSGLCSGSGSAENRNMNVNVNVNGLGSGSGSAENRNMNVNVNVNGSGSGSGSVEAPNVPIFVGSWRSMRLNPISPLQSIFVGSLVCFWIRCLHAMFKISRTSCTSTRQQMPIEHPHVQSVGSIVMFVCQEVNTTSKDALGRWFWTFLIEQRLQGFTTIQAPLQVQ